MPTHIFFPALSLSFRPPKENGQQLFYFALEAKTEDKILFPSVSPLHVSLKL